MKVFTYFAFFVLCGPQHLESPSCSINPSVPDDGDQVILTCDLQHDYKEKDFNVYVYKENEPALLYTKFLNKSPRYEYYEEGYRVSGDVRRKLSVVLDSVVPEQTGNYSCQVLEGTGNKPSCSLQVKEKAPESKCEIRPVMVGDNATVTCLFNVDLLRGHYRFTLMERSKSDRPLRTVVECFREDEDSKTCNNPRNDCERQKNITCEYDSKQYNVDTASMTPTTFIVDVINVSSQSYRFYACGTIPGKAKDHKSCQLHVKETEQGEAKVTAPLIIAVYVLSAVVALVCAVVFFKIFCKSLSNRTSPPPMTPDSRCDDQHRRWVPDILQRVLSKVLRSAKKHDPPQCSMNADSGRYINVPNVDGSECFANLETEV